MSASFPGTGSLGVLLERGVSRSLGEKPDGLRHGQLLLREPSALREPPLDVHPGHGRVQPAHRVERLDRPVGAEGDPGPAVEEGPPGVGAPGPLVSDPGLAESHVGRAVGRLHGGDDAEGREPVEVGRSDDLGVLDPVPEARPSRSLLGPLQGVEDPVYALSPMACVPVWKPFASASAMRASNSASGSWGRPALPGSSEKGANMRAVPDPRVPSMNAFRKPMRTMSSRGPGVAFSRTSFRLSIGSHA